LHHQIVRIARWSDLLAAELRRILAIEYVGVKFDVGRGIAPASYLPQHFACSLYELGL
jgi:hypothetical protein